MMATGNDTIPSVRLTDPLFQSVSLADSHFLIHIATGNLSYAVLDGVSNTVVGFCSHTLIGNDYLNDAIAILNREEWAKERFAQVQVVIEPTDYVVVPQPLFDPNDIAPYLRFHSFHEPSGSLLYDTIESLGIVGAYHLPHQALNTIDRLLGNINVSASPSPFIQLATREYKAVKSDHLLVMFTANKMHLVGMQQGKFVYYNSFEVAAKEDVSYYTLAACEQLYLSPEKVLVNVWGDGPDYTNYLSTLQYYFRNVAQGARPKALKYADALGELSQFSHYPLFAVALCE